MFLTTQDSIRSDPSYPPGPTGHWLLGTLPAFRQNLLGTLESWLERFGDAIRFRYFVGRHGYLFCHPDHYRHILQEKQEQYTKRPNPIFDILRVVGGEGLLTSDGPMWLRQRRLMGPAFHRQHIAGFSEVMIAAVGRMLDRWAELADREQTVNVADEMVFLALEVVGRTLFSADLTSEVETVHQAFSDITRQFRQLSSHPLGVYFGLWLLKFPFLPDTRRLRRAAALLDEVVRGIIARRRQAQAGGRAENHDLLAMLMDARDEETGERMSDRQLRDEVLTILLTGHETVAVALTAVFALLAMHPDVRAKLEREVDRVLAGRLPAFDDLEALPYTRKVIEESLRLYPPIYATARTAKTADRVSGYDVDAGSIVTLSPYLTHRHPEFWSEPDRFDPGRFSPERNQDRRRDAYIPFGTGPRMCIGSSFAMTEITLVLAMVVKRFRLDLAPGHHLELKPLITLHPHNGLLMTLLPR